MRQPQHLTDFPHRHSHPRHRQPLFSFTGTADLLIRMSKGVLSKRSSKTVRNHRNAVRNASECLSAMGRNLQTAGVLETAPRRAHAAPADARAADLALTIA